MHASHLDDGVRGMYWWEVIGKVEQGYTHLQVAAADIKKRYPFDPQWFFRNDITRYGGVQEKFSMDTIIASKEGRGFPIRTNGWACNNVQSIARDCSFNEVAICSVLGRWIGFGYYKTGGALRNSMWFRPVRGVAVSYIPEWKAIYTQNKNVKVKVRYGRRDSFCAACIEKPCPPDQDVEFEEIFTAGGSWRYNLFVSSASISCMKVELKDNARTCNVKINTQFGHKFTKVDYPVQYYIDDVSFPSRYDVENQYHMQNAIYDPIKKLTENVKITACKSGFGMVNINGVFRCFGQFSEVCKSSNGGKVVTNCGNQWIYQTCAHLLRVGIWAFDECFEEGVLKCQNLKIIDVILNTVEKAVSANSYADMCRTGSDICLIENQFYDMVLMKCRDCENLLDIDGFRDKAWDSIGDAEMTCKGMYPGRTICISSENRQRYMIIPAPAGMETNPNAACRPCPVTPPVEGTFIAKQCVSNWTHSPSKPKYSLVFSGREIGICDSDCGAGFYSQCSSVESCTECTCESSCGSGVENRYNQFCWGNNAECDGNNKFVSTGYECLNYTSVSCPVGSVYSKGDRIENIGDKVLTFLDMVDVQNHTCSTCEHPGVDPPNGLDRCNLVEYWPGCVEEGLTQTPGCTQCPSVEHSSWYYIN